MLFYSVTTKLLFNDWWLILIVALWGITMSLVGILSAKFFKGSKEAISLKTDYSYNKTSVTL